MQADMKLIVADVLIEKLCTVLTNMRGGKKKSLLEMALLLQTEEQIEQRLMAGAIYGPENMVYLSVMVNRGKKLSSQK